MLRKYVILKLQISLDFDCFWVLFYVSLALGLVIIFCYEGNEYLGDFLMQQLTASISALRPQEVQD